MTKVKTEPAPAPKLLKRNDTFIKNGSYRPFESDYSNNYIHSNNPPIHYIENINDPLEGYPKLRKLHELKKAQISDHATDRYGVRCEPHQIIPTLNTWINQYRLQFDVIMVGALTDNQFIYPLLSQLPLHKLCLKPGFLFIWASTHKIKELTALFNSDSWGKKFRRLEELIFVPLNKNSPYYPKTEWNDSKVPLFERQQWHCWMCITGTVRRSTDNHLIHCNVDTDLQIETNNGRSDFTNAVPDNLYKVVENFSNSQRRLHIIPSYVKNDLYVKLRPGWVIILPDSMLNNFDPRKYQEQLLRKSLVKGKNSLSGAGGTSYLVPQTNEIEELRPKSPHTNKRDNRE